MGKKMIMILTGTVLLAAVFIGVFVYQKQTDDRRKNKVEESKKETENSSPSRKEKEEGGQRKQQETEIRNGEKESRKEEEKERKTSETMKGEIVPEMKLSGFPEEVFNLLGKDPIELSEVVKQWLQENGFSSATGVEYSEPIEVRFQEKKCIISCRILFEEQGNGIHQESGTQIIFLDYFWEENLLQIHK